MHIVISPAKKLDYSPTDIKNSFTIPSFLNEAEILIKKLRSYTPANISKLMNVSPAIAELNFDRYAKWSQPFNKGNAKEAILAFNGEVYAKMHAKEFTTNELEFAQNHLTILSGLYAALRPLDIIQPYRLEMGTKLKVKRSKNLYEFWGNKITDFVNQRLKESETTILINLASNEYFKSINKKVLQADIITPVFKIFKNGKYSTPFIYAKQARGMMCNFIIKNKLSDPEEIKLFDMDGYHFDAPMSGENEWVFTR